MSALCANVNCRTPVEPQLDILWMWSRGCEALRWLLTKTTLEPGILDGGIHGHGGERGVGQARRGRHRGWKVAAVGRRKVDSWEPLRGATAQQTSYIRTAYACVPGGHAADDGMGGTQDGLCLVEDMYMYMHIHTHTYILYREYAPGCWFPRGRWWCCVFPIRTGCTSPMQYSPMCPLHAPPTAKPLS
jgi:hypothetical protein